MAESILKSVPYSIKEIYAVWGYWIRWDMHPYDAVALYMEWGNNWNRGLDHAKSCNEASAYFKIDATTKPYTLRLVYHEHSSYFVIAEIVAPQELIDESVQMFACKNKACGISPSLREWLKKEVE